MDASSVYVVDTMGVSQEAAPLMPKVSNYSMENPANPLDGGSLDEWGGLELHSESGMKVSESNALSCPAVWQAISQISGDIAKLPLHLYRRLEGDARERASDHPTYNLVRRKPNREMDAFKFWRRVMVQLLLYNNGYIYISMSGRGPAELAPLLSDRTEPKRVDGRLFYVSEVNGEIVPIPQEQVIHIEGISADNLSATRLVRHARRAIGLSLAAHNFASKFFARGGRKGGVLEIPAGSFRKTSADALEEGFRKKYDNPDAAFLTVILREGAKFHEAQSSLEESQMTEARRENVRDIARYFNLRPGRLGEESTVSYSSKSEDNRDYLDTTLSPHLEAIVGQCNIKLLSDAEQQTHYFEHNTERLLRMDPLKHMSQLTQGVRGEIITRNEARKTLNLPPVEGGDELINPSINPSNGVPDSVNAAHRELIASLTGVVVNAVAGKAVRLAASPKAFIRWIDGSLREERERLAKAILPAMACVTAITGEDEEILATRHADSCLDRILAKINSIVETATEAELRDAVAAFFENWEQEP